MEYANVGRVFREVAGAVKDMFVVYIKPRAGDFADKGKEIVLFPYKQMIVPIFQYIKSKLGGRKGDLLIDVNGKRIKFIVPEKYTKLGLGREFNNIIREHEDVLNFYENWPDRKLYIDTDMNIYELANGSNSMAKIFGDGRFYDDSEIKQIPVEKVLDYGVRSVEDYIDRQRELVHAEKDNFIPLSNIFPSSNQQEARDQLNDYLFEAFIHSHVSEDTKKIHKVKSLDANSFSNLLERLKQERNLERETNMLERLETDEAFLRALSNKELAKKAEEIYNIYMKKGALSVSNWVDTLRKKDNATYYNSVNPFRNYYLEAMDDNIKSVQALAPSIKGLIGDRAKNLAIDAGIGVLGSTAHLWVPPLVGSVALLAQFLLKRAFQIRRVDRRIEYTEKLENLLETSIKINEAVQLQFSGNLTFQQNSNRLMSTIVDSIKQVKNDINNMNSEKNIKQLEYARKKVFDKIKKENPDDQFIFKDQEVPFSESLRKIEVASKKVFNNLIKDNPNDKLVVEHQDVPYTVESIEVGVPRQKKLNMPKKRETVDYAALENELYDKYVTKRADPFPLKAWLGKLKANNQYGPKYNVLKKIVGLIGPPPPAPAAPSYNDINRDRPEWDISDIGIIEDRAALPFVDDVLAMPAPPPKKWKTVKASPDENLLFTKLYDTYVLGGEPLSSLEAEIEKRQDNRKYGSEYNIYKAIYDLAVDKYKGIEDKKPLPFIEESNISKPEFLKNYAYQGDNDKINWQNLKVEDVYESPNKKIKIDWPNGTFPSTSEKIKGTAEKIWGKCFFIFFIF